MDYSINLDTMNTKQSELDSIKTKAEDIYNEFNSSYLNQLASTEIRLITAKLRQPVERLKKGVTNSNTWYKKYLTELTALEDSLSSFSASNLDKPKIFSDKFTDLFSKKAMPLLKTGYEESLPASLQDLPYGSFTKEKFRASNGVTVEYFVYTPKGVENMEGLPVMLYMHGGSTRGTSRGTWLNYGLTKLVKDQKVTPNGIVICPYIKNFEGDNITLVMKELTDKVASQYKADTNRISVGGHSYGAITAYQMVNKYPNYFSAVIPISGWNKVTGAFSGVKVWAFHGDKDNRGGKSRTTYPGALKAVDQINSVGGTAAMHTFVGKGHSWVQNYTFEEAYDSPDGKKETALDWAFRQDKRKNKKGN